jgi:hypothetical protein
MTASGLLPVEIALTVVPDENRMVQAAAASTMCGSGRTRPAAAAAAAAAGGGPDTKLDQSRSPCRSCGCG